MVGEDIKILLEKHPSEEHGGRCRRMRVAPLDTTPSDVHHSHHSTDFFIQVFNIELTILKSPKTLVTKFNKTLFKDTASSSKHLHSERDLAKIDRTKS